MGFIRAAGGSTSRKGALEGRDNLTGIVNGRRVYLHEWRVGGVSEAEGSVEGISAENDRRR